MKGRTLTVGLQHNRNPLMCRPCTLGENRVDSVQCFLLCSCAELSCAMHKSTITMVYLEITVQHI